MPRDLSARARPVAPALEPLEARRLLTIEPFTLIDEVLVPGDLGVGAAPHSQVDPAVSEGPDGVTLAVWGDYRTGGHPSVPFGLDQGTQGDIWAARIAADGSVIDQTPIPVNHDGWNQSRPQVAWNGQHWLVAWHSQQDPYNAYVHATRIDASGNVVDAQPILIMDKRWVDQYGNQVSPGQPLDVEPAAAGGWVVTWWRGESNPNGIYGADKAFYATRVTSAGAVLDADGVELSRGPYNITDWFGLEYSPSNGGQFLQAHEDNGVLYTRRRGLDLSPQGAASGRSGQKANPYEFELVGSPAGWLLASRWDEGGATGRSEINAWRIDTAGAFLDGPAGLNLYLDYFEDPKVGAAWDGNGYAVAYTDGSQIQARRVPAAGAPGAQTTLQTFSNPAYDLDAVGHGGGKFSLLFADSQGGTTDVAVVHVDAADAVTGVADVSLAGRGHTGPANASDGANVLSVFQSFDEDVNELKAIRLDNAGQPIDAEPFVVAPASANVGSYRVVHFAGRYVVLYVGDGASGRMIYGQQVGSDGRLIDAPVAVAPSVDYVGFNLVDAAVNGDRLLLTGNAQEGGLHISRKFGRVFDANLAPTSARFSISPAYVLGGQTVAVGDRWLSVFAFKSTHDAPRRAVGYAFVNSDGTLGPTATLVGSYPDNGIPTVASAGPGSAEALIVFQRRNGLYPWESVFVNSDEGLAAQRIAADGALVGPLYPLIDVGGEQRMPAASFDGSNYVVAWVDGRQRPYPQQENADVYAARVAIDGTVLDGAGLPVANSLRPEDGVTVTSGGGHTFFAYRQFRYESPYASYRITTRTLDDVTAPAGNGASFNVNAEQAIGMSFSERVFGLSGSDLVVQNLTTGQVVDASGFELVETVGAAGEWTYALRPTGGTAAPYLPDGNYRATLPAGSTVDKAGNPLAAPLSAKFYVLRGDANGDRYVNLADFGIVRANFGGSNRTWAQGDFNYDGAVNLADFGILRANFGTFLPPPGGGNLFGGDDGGSGDDEL